MAFSIRPRVFWINPQSRGQPTTLCNPQNKSSRAAGINGNLLTSCPLYAGTDPPNGHQNKTTPREMGEKGLSLRAQQAVNYGPHVYACRNPQKPWQQATSQLLDIPLSAQAFASLTEMRCRWFAMRLR